MAAVDKAGCVSDVLLRTVFLYHVFEYHVSLQVFTTQACMCTSLVTSVDLGHVYVGQIAYLVGVRLRPGSTSILSLLM